MRKPHLFHIFLCFGLLIYNPLQSQVKLDSLGKYGDKMLHGLTEQERTHAQDIFSNMLDSIIGNRASFSLSFSKIKSLSVQEAPDNTFRIFTWNTRTDEGGYKYYGRLQFPAGRKNEYQVIKLDDQSEEINSPETKKLGPAEWYGAVYYQIIHKKYKKKDYYTLLGWDGNDKITTKKLIDVLVLDKSGDITFGAPIFEYGKIRHRIFFEYGKKVTMALNYEKKDDLIVFDHLSPTESSLKGQYAFYGPDFSYEALRFKKGRWILIKNHLAKNQNSNEGKSNRKPQNGLFDKK